MAVYRGWSICLCRLNAKVTFVVFVILAHTPYVCIVYAEWCLERRVMSVCSTEEQQLERLMQRNDFPEEEARRRIASQMPLAEKAQKADFLVDNSHSVEETQRQVVHVYSKLKRLSWWCGLHRWLVLLLCVSFVFCAVLMLL